MEQYLDQRIINTKQCFYTALFSLIKTKSYISVLDVCRKADRSNITFYHHYGNISELMQEAINDQLNLRLPIPVKLKPNNLRQLIYYIIRFFNEFCINNKILLICAFNLIYQKIKNSYLDLWIKTISYHINKEIQQLCDDSQPINNNIISDFITFGFIGLFLKRIILNKSIENEIIKNSINLFINNYVNLK